MKLRRGRGERKEEAEEEERKGRGRGETVHMSVMTEAEVAGSRVPS